MNKHIISAITAAILLSSCHKPDPSKYVSTAFINANMLHGFAGRMLNDEMAGMSRHNNNGMTVPGCAAFISQQTAAATDALKRINKLPSDKDAQPMINASKAVFSFAITVYKNEYSELAALYDKGSDSATTGTRARLIEQQYHERFAALYNRLREAGMAYAAQHHIRVMNVQTAPGTAGSQ